MHKITEVTRRDIIDIIRNGFVGTDYELKRDYYERQYTEEIDVEYRICYHGRLSEIDFLSRVYDLEKMPSTDNRFKNAQGDIWQHTINNNDWDVGWVFFDPRFKLASGDDETFLRFLCEMFHPIVRNEHQPWMAFLEMFNELLKNDGYQIVEKSHISGRSVYGWEKITPNTVIVPDRKQSASYDLKMIGEGSYAQVFKYKDSFYDKIYVIKRAKRDLTEKELMRFKREFQQMKDLHSPYIVEVYSYSESSNEYIMEFMDCTLDKYISENNGKLTFSQRKGIVLQILRAFKYIHSKDLLHRDISPKNVLLKLYDDVRVVKISDFGLVKIPNTDLTSMNTEYKGYFNDPELRLDGFNTYSVIHETYAITRLVYFVMTGRTNTTKINNITLEEFVKKGLSSNKKNRFQDIDELIIAFDKVVE